MGKPEAELNDGEGPVYEAIHAGRIPRESDSITTMSNSTQNDNAQPEKHVLSGGGVNVSRAEADFADLNRELSRASHLSRIQSRQSRKGRVMADIEKAGDEDSSEDQFDLETVLRGNRDEEERSGIKSKRIGVVFEDLTVSGIGGVKNYVKTFPDAFVSFFNVFETGKSLLGLGKKGKEFDILKDFRGVVKPGEMCLVLGRPGSGCTTFLKVISNQRYGYTKVDGKVLYGPFDADFFEKRYRGESVYCEEVRFFPYIIPSAYYIGLGADFYRTKTTIPHSPSDKPWISLLKPRFRGSDQLVCREKISKSGSLTSC